MLLPANTVSLHCIDMRKRCQLVQILVLCTPWSCVGIQGSRSDWMDFASKHNICPVLTIFLSMSSLKNPLWWGWPVRLCTDWWLMHCFRFWINYLNLMNPS